MAKRKKLYFDVIATAAGGGSPTGTISFIAPCTPGFAAFFAAITGTPNLCWGDRITGNPSEFCEGCPTCTRVRTLSERYGGFLDTLPALTGGSAPEVKRRNSVSAWFQLAANQGNVISNSNAVGIGIQFMRAGLNDEATPAAVPILYPTGAPALSVPGKLGQDAVYATDFGVLLRISRHQQSQRLFGVLYVQRQHSIEV